jgi:hypothetical protein
MEAGKVEGAGTAESTVAGEMGRTDAGMADHPSLGATGMGLMMGEGASRIVDLIGGVLEAAIRVGRGDLQVLRRDCLRADTTMLRHRQ